MRLKKCATFYSQLTESPIFSCISAASAALLIDYYPCHTSVRLNEKCERETRETGDDTESTTHMEVCKMMTNNADEMFWLEGAYIFSFLQFAILILDEYFQELCKKEWYF